MTWVIGISIFGIFFTTVALLFLTGAGRANQDYDRIMREADREHARLMRATRELLEKHQTKKD